MKPSKLFDKFIELYSSGQAPDNTGLTRCVETFLHCRYDSRKTKRVVESMKEKYDFKSLYNLRENRNRMSSCLDSIVMNRVRNAYKEKKSIDIDTLSNILLVTLVKIVLLDNGYNVLYIPPLNTGGIDLVMYRDDYKIAVFITKNAVSHTVSEKTVSDARKASMDAHCEQTLIFSSSYFEKNARSFAEAHNIILIDRDKLVILIDDLISSEQRKENKYLLSEIEKMQDDTLYLEADIKSSRTKVRVKDIEYITDRDNNHLVFKGILANTGKRPVEKLTLNLKIYGRDRTVVDSIGEEVGNGILNNGEQIDFQCVFKDISEYQWKNICRYMLKLTYRNL